MLEHLIRDLSSSKNAPYWGPPTTSVDWCEMNYEVTPYIAEYFNTISSFAMAILGLLGIYLHPWAERRFKVAFFATFIVGLGSITFHGTLTKISQAFDEVPMLYTAFAFLYITLVQRYQFRTSTRYQLASALCIWASITTYLITAYEGKWQFIFFHVSFGSAQWYALFQMGLMYFDQKSKNQSASMVGLFERGLALIILAFACWLTDMLGCEYVNPHYTTAFLPWNPQFHSWWHILMTLGVYHQAAFCLIARMNAKLNGKMPVLHYKFGIIPYVTIEKVTIVNEKSMLIKS
jgi:dihydroceramidase